MTRFIIFCDLESVDKFYPDILFQLHCHRGSFTIPSEAPLNYEIDHVSSLTVSITKTKYKTMYIFRGIYSIKNSADCKISSTGIPYLKSQ